MGVSMPNSEQTNKLIELLPVLSQLRSAACKWRWKQRNFHEQTYREGDWLLTPGFLKVPKMVFYKRV